MLLLVSGATKSIEKYKHKKNLGQLLTPRSGNSIDKIIKNGLTWACDNACYSGFNEEKYINMVENVHNKLAENIQCKPRLKFISMPDKVCDASETKKLFDLWYPKMLKYFDIPLAYVLQDGVTEEEVPWDKIAAVFIGGSTKFKLGIGAANIVKIAKYKGKWVHMGRVNSEKRLIYAIQIGCDSVDGSKYSMYPDVHIPKALQTLENEQMSIEGCF